MSYADERDEIAEFFGAKSANRTSGYSEELEKPLSDLDEPVPKAKRYLKLPPSDDLDEIPLDRMPVRKPSSRPIPPVMDGPVIADDEIMVYDPADVPDFSELRIQSGRVEQKSPPPQIQPRSEIPAPLPEKRQERVEPVAEPVSRPVTAEPPKSSPGEHHFVSEENPSTANAKPAILETRGLVKIYDGRTVVNGVDIKVRPGEVVGLLGPNGAGKTTSFYMIVGLVPPNGGEVLFHDKDVTSLPMYKRARLGMGYLPQEESIFRKLTVEENIMAVMETLNLSRRESLARCQELLERFSITHIRKNIALTCSGGEKRRLTIARSLVTRPSLLMLDEPFSGVDPIAVNEIQNIVSDLRNSGLAVLITDHNARQTLELVDRAYLIYEGKVLREGTRDFLINDPVSRKLYLGDRFTM